MKILACLVLAVAACSDPTAPVETEPDAGIQADAQASDAPLASPRWTCIVMRACGAERAEPWAFVVSAGSAQEASNFALGTCQKSALGPPACNAPLTCVTQLCAPPQ